MKEDKLSVLAVDDEADMRQTYQTVLQKNFNVLTAASGKEALKIVQSQPVALVILDIRMPQMDGITTLKKIKDLDPDLAIIMVSATKDITSAVSAMKLGAFDYVSKPFDVKELLALIDMALEKRRLIRENLYLKDSLKEATSYCDLIGQSEPMKKLFAAIDSIAPTDSTVLVRGESGTGKELVARAIHKKSRRANDPFVAVNCAAIPENLLESELFGYERGAFTGALERKLGKFELADGGTLFLDEIGCMSLPMQAKLLRVLEDRVIERIGGEKGVPVNVRIVSATNIDFDQHIKENKFRHDLYYRLNVIPLNLPPLRERKDDLSLLIDYFLNKFNTLLNKKISGFSPEALKVMKSYEWPGNIRELQNLVERVVVLSRQPVIAQAELGLPNKK
ncbi:sigma-54-dependent Fis family transcriptional regulator [Candidatus Saganbacteria bacterium]|nr:sigma-54-dependent Fis family transcriptional regulator [Candidatus Saganbacteria bacterium]